MSFDPKKKVSLDTRTYMDGQVYAVKMINVKKAEKNGVQLAALKREVHMPMLMIRHYV